MEVLIIQARLSMNLKHKDKILKNITQIKIQAWTVLFNGICQLKVISHHNDGDKSHNRSLKNIIDG